jgi:agmatine/peptidylarginine deiminase
MTARTIFNLVIPCSLLQASSLLNFIISNKTVIMPKKLAIHEKVIVGYLSTNSLSLCVIFWIGL